MRVWRRPLSLLSVVQTQLSKAEKQKRQKPFSESAAGVMFDLLRVSRYCIAVSCALLSQPFHQSYSMKIRTLPICLLAAFCLFSFTNSSAQGYKVIASDDKECVAKQSNPVNDWFVIRTGSNLPGRMVLYNEAGQAVKTATVESTTTIMNASRLPAGIYHVEITQGGKTQQLTIVKN